MTAIVNQETARAPANVDAEAKRATNRRAAWSRFMPPLALFVGVVVAWEAVSRMFRLPEFVLPAPTAIVEVLIAHQASLAYAAFVTSQEVLWGFLLSAVIGAGVALVIARFAAFGRALYPLVVLFQNVPKVALAPLFILWFGFDLAPKVVLIVVIAFFPVAINMLVGLQTVDANLVARHEEHRMVAAHQPVELHRDIVRGLCNAGTHRPDAGDRKHPPYPFADHHDYRPLVE